VATIQDIARGLNGVRTAGQAKIAIGEALSELGRAYRLADGENARTLDRVRLPLEAWILEIALLPDASDYRSAFQARRDTITRAYVESLGILGTIQARRSVSFVDELGTGFAALPGQLGQAVGAVAKGAGETAGSLLGGLLSGLGPIVVIVIALAVYAAWRAKTK
jgi:hypothetical protein